jgi:uncharacterized membrane protein YdcZ (DUF606 family)
MKTKGLGIALIVIGILMTIYTGFNYVTTEKVVDLGPIKIEKEQNHPVQWAPIIGVIILAAGGFLVVRSEGKKE